MIDRFGVDEELADLMVERQKVYGDPEVNHSGIAQVWASLLQPWALRIALMQPIPTFVVASLLSGLKLNRRRFRFHQDNYDDAASYDAFSNAWQKEFQSNGGDGYTAGLVLTTRPSPDAVLELCWRVPTEDGGYKHVTAAHMLDPDGRQTLLAGMDMNSGPTTV
jgi:hypothetical protein